MNRHFEAVQSELAETGRQLTEVKGDPRIRLKLLRKMRELLNEADRIVAEQLKSDSFEGS